MVHAWHQETTFLTSLTLKKTWLCKTSLLPFNYLIGKEIKPFSATLNGSTTSSCSPSATSVCSESAYGGFSWWGTELCGPDTFLTTALNAAALRTTSSIQDLAGGGGAAVQSRPHILWVQHQGLTAACNPSTCGDTPAFPQYLHTCA